MDNHSGWNLDTEKLVLNLVSDYKKRMRGDHAELEGRYTYAVRCIEDKPKKKIIDCCSTLFHTELTEYAVEHRPIMVFALGPAVLKSLGVKYGKYNDIQGKFLEVTIQGRRVLVYPSLSKRQLASKAGYVDVTKRHLGNFLDGAVGNKNGHTVATEVSMPQLTEEYEFPRTPAEVEDLALHIINYARPGEDPAGAMLSIDTETNTLFPHRPKLKMLSVVAAWDKGKACSIPFEHPDTPWDPGEVRQSIWKILTCNKPKVGHNFKFDIKVLERKGFKVRQARWDTMLGEHLLEEDKKGYYSLKHLTKLMLPRYAGYEDQLHDILTLLEAPTQVLQLKQEEENVPPVVPKSKLKGAAKKLAQDIGYLHIPLKELNEYGAIDADVTRQLAGMQRKRMLIEQKHIVKRRNEYLRMPNAYFRAIGQPGTTESAPLEHLMQHHCIPATKTLAQMESIGMRVNREYVDDLLIDMDQSLRESRQELNQMIPPGITFNGEPFNPGSAPNIRKVLFGTGYLHPKTKETICYKGIIDPPTTATGLVSTNQAFLRSILVQHECPFAAAILSFRATSKARNTFVANIHALSAEDGRMHTSFHIAGASTGRLCVSGDTLLETTSGTFRISKLDLVSFPNAQILTHKNRLRRILNVFYKGKEQMYRVVLESGEQIDVTKGHRFFTPSGVQHLSDLTIGAQVTSIKSGRKNPFCSSPIVDISPIGVKEVWDIEVEEDHSFVAQGYVNHNSSSDENMQNVPHRIRNHNLKQIFIPTHPDKEVIGNADAKAAEVRVYAAYSGDANLIKALNDGMDPHSFFASMVYSPDVILKGIPSDLKHETLATVGIDDIHSWSYADFQNRDNFSGTDTAYGSRLNSLRKTIKRVVFGILYGASRRKISQIVGIPPAQAEVIIRALFSMFPTIEKYIRRTEEQVKLLGMVETFFGRRRRFDLKRLTYSMRSKANRQAVNFKIQSTSSDMVLNVMCKMEEPLRRDFRGRMLITVHDSVVFELPKEYVSQMPDFVQDYGVKQVAERFPWMPVPFEWDVEVGPSYGELTSVENYLNDNPEYIQGDADEHLEQDIRSEFIDIGN